jgi:hypothetical protein
MFPALRQNGIARWMVVVLALFWLAAGQLLGLALSAGVARGRALGSGSDRTEAEAGSNESLVPSGTLSSRSPAK